MRRSILMAIFLWAVYMGVLFFWDTKSGDNEFIQYADLWQAFPGMMMLAFCSYFLRYLRWKLMFAMRDMSWPFWAGFLAYLSGFAFTVTPGKLGELFRVHYFKEYGIPPRPVVSGFFFERCLDLIIVLILALMFFPSSSIYPVVLFFVLLALMVVSGVIFFSVWLRWSAKIISQMGYKRVGRMVTYVAGVAYGIRSWCQWKMLIPCLCLGMTAWVTMALTLVWLFWWSNLLEVIPVARALAMYPFAMLAGAASMMPGGLGTTEAVIGMSLQQFGVGISFAMVCAMVVRLATMWFAVACGFASIAIMEMRQV